MSQRSILVYGATGAQGSAVAKRLLKAGYRVVAPVRNRAKASALREQGAEVVESDFSVRSLTEITRKAEAVFFQVPASVSPAEMVNFADKALTAVREANSPHTVVSISSIVPTQPVGIAGPDARLKIKELTEELVPSAVILSLTLYLENFSVAYRQAIEQGVIPQAIPADVPVAYLSLQDHAAFVQAALERPQLAGKFLQIGGNEALTGQQLAERLGKLLGKSLHYQTISPQELAGFLTPIIGETVALQVAEMYAWEGTSGKELLAPDLADTVKTLSVQLSSFEEWAVMAFNQSNTPV